jgi:SAM-dependent methyltransferase
MKTTEELAEAYKNLHIGTQFYRNGELISSGSFSIFDGAGIKPFIPDLLNIVKEYGGNILDFGCGKAVHWTKRVVEGKSLSEFLDKYLVGFRRYDPYHSLYCSKPTGTYDIVICTDVLEHIPIEDVSKLLQEIAGYTRSGGIILFTVNTKLSRNAFLDGTNMHVTLLNEEEWIKIIDENITTKYKLIIY